jgi:ribosomal protein L12E/L44/L45/RPP1/RPP2
MTMPLIKSCNDKDRETNIKEMIEAGHPPAVAEAASYHNQREAERMEHEKHKYGR